MPFPVWPAGADSDALLMPPVGDMTFGITITGPEPHPYVGNITCPVVIFGPNGWFPHEPLSSVPMPTEVGVRIYGLWRNAIQPAPPVVPPPYMPGTGPDGPLQAPAPPGPPAMQAAGGGAIQTGLTFTTSIGEAGSGQVTGRGGGSAGDRDDVLFFVGGAAKFGGFVTGVQDVAIGPGDTAAVVRALTVSGFLAEWQYMKVLPDLGGEDPAKMGAPASSDRHFGYMSSTGIDTTTGAWRGATVTPAHYGGDPNGAADQRPNFVQPKGWPWLQSEWIGPSSASGSSGGYVVRSNAFSCPPGYYAIYVACKDEYDLWLDGVELGSRTGFYGGQAERYDVVVGDHFHFFAAACTSRGGRTGFNLAMMPYASTATPGHAKYQTDGGWLVLPTDTPPGMSVGQILHVLFAEAQARGALPGWSLGFSPHADSNGQAWPIISNYSLPIGMDGLAVLQQMGNQFFDFWCASSSRTLIAVQSGTVGGAGSEDPLVSLATSTDSSQAYDRVLVQYDGPGGQVMVGSGPREGVVKADGVTLESGAKQIGSAWLKINSQARVTLALQGLPKGEGGPQSTYNYDLGGSLAGQRVAGVTATMDDATGQVTVIPQLSDSLTIAMEKFNRKLLSIANGAAGQASGPGNGTPKIEPGRPADDAQLPPYVIDGVLTDVTNASPGWSPGRPCIITRIFGGLRVAGTTQTIIELLADDVVKALILVAPGKKRYSVDIANLLLLPTDSVSYQVTGGKKAAGLSVQTMVAYT